MAVVRFGVDGSEVHVYETSQLRAGGGEWVESPGEMWCCWNCALAPASQYIGGWRAVEMHLLVHRAAGHLVPDWAFESRGF